MRFAPTFLCLLLHLIKCQALCDGLMKAAGDLRWVPLKDLRFNECPPIENAGNKDTAYVKGVHKDLFPLTTPLEVN